MQKKTRSLIRRTAAAAMALSVCCAPAAVVAVENVSPAKPVSGTESGTADSKALEDALAKVKKRINIPEEYSDFSYTKNTSSAIDTYTFTWKTDSEIASDVNKSISVRISGDQIVSYNKSDSSYNEYPGKPSFGRLSDEQIIKAAKNAAAVFNPHIAENIVINSDVNRSLSGKTVSVGFCRVNDGVKLEKNSGHVVLDKDTGEVIRFSLTWWADAKFKKASSAVSSEKIEKAYTENVELIPVYRITAEEDDKKSTVIVYTPEDDVVFDADLARPTTMFDDYAASQNTDNYSLDATFGAKNTVTSDDGDYAEESATAADMGSGSARSYKVFTDAEKSALIDSGKYYSKSDMAEVLKEDKYLGLTDKYVLNYAEFTKTEDDNVPSGYAWNMNFYINNSDTYKSIDVMADAESGKIVSFWKYSSDEPKKTINIKKITKVAEAAANYYIPDIFSEYTADDSNTADAEKATSRNLVFNRMHEGIRVDGNNVNITVNSDGEVMSFYYSYDDVEFVSPEMISADEAFEKLFEQTDFELSYNGFLTLDGKSQIYLLYSLDNYNLNAKTGELCDYFGRKIVKPSDDTGCPYTDISGTGSEKYIRKLYDYGITLPDAETEFRPNEGITERDFAYLLDCVNYSGLQYELYGDYAYDSTSKVGTNTLTKLGSAKLFVTSAGGKNFAELKGIYRSPFKDITTRDENLGYIAMAYAMGAAKPDSNGNFNPNGKVTRGYAMYLICSYIENGSK